MINAIKNSIISFKKIPLKTKNDLIFATDYKIQRKNEPDVFIKSDLDYGHNFFITKIADENDNLIAVNHFALDKADGIIETSAMNVLSKNYRNKGLGTIMHLDRIVDLLENDMDKIVLFSTGEAALFHSKLKFEPDLNNGEQLENVLTEISAKNGVNIEEVLERIITDIPAPTGDADAPLKALIFDSVYDPYRGVIVLMRVFDGTIRKGSKVKMMATGKEFDVVEVGIFGPGRFLPADELSAGMVGYFTASIKNVADTRVGDTVTEAARPTAEALPGYKKVNPMVYCGIFPVDGAKYPDLRDALEKLQLNDASLFFEPETSIALGFGFRCGFLGLLHLEIIQERLEREYNLDLVTTAPSVIYKVYLTDGTQFDLSNPSNMPDPARILKMEEPIVKAEIMLPKDYIGPIMELCQQRRGDYISMEYLDASRAMLVYEMPLNEIIYDFFDVLKSRSRGYASFDYSLIGYKESELVKLDILVNREPVDALSFIVHKASAVERGRKMCEKLKKEIPRHLFEIPIQAAIGSKIIARETISAMRKDVLAKCYGGDISRKKKLLEKQKEGKKRMRQIGSVEVPQQAFMSVLKLEEE